MDEKDETADTESTRRECDEARARERDAADNSRQGERLSFDRTLRHRRGGRPVREGLERERQLSDASLRRERERSDSTRAEERAQADDELLEERTDDLEREAEELRRSAQRKRLLNELKAALDVVAASVGALGGEASADERGRHLRACADRTEQANRTAMQLVVQLIEADEAQGGRGQDCR